MLENLSINYAKELRRGEGPEQASYYNGRIARGHSFIPETFSFNTYGICGECGELCPPAAKHGYKKGAYKNDKGYMCNNGHWYDYKFEFKEIVNVIEAEALSSKFMSGINNLEKTSEKLQKDSGNFILGVYLVTLSLICLVVTGSVFPNFNFNRTDILFMIFSAIIIAPVASFISYATIMIPNCDEKLLNSLDRTFCCHDNYSLEHNKNNPITFINHYRYYFNMEKFNRREIEEQIKLSQKAAEDNNYERYRNIIDTWGELTYVIPNNKNSKDMGLISNNYENASIKSLTNNGEPDTLERDVVHFVSYKYTEEFIDTFDKDFIKLLEVFEASLKDNAKKSLTIGDKNLIKGIIKEYENTSKITVEAIKSGADGEQLKDYMEIIENYNKIIGSIRDKSLESKLHELKVSNNYVKDKYWSEING